MCLSTVQHDISQEKLPEFGWRVFVGQGNGVSSLYHGNIGIKKRKKWYRNEGKERIGYPSMEYSSGFHVFRTKKVAQCYKKDLLDALFVRDPLKVQKVKMKKLRAKGTQRVVNMGKAGEDADVFVVQSMLIV